MPEQTTPIPDGPFETEQDAIRHPAVQEIYEAGNLTDASHRMLERACSAAGVELGHFDHKIILWLAGWEPAMGTVVAGLITRAHQAGKAAPRPAPVRADHLEKCHWCLRRNVKASDWEQEAIRNGGWHRLCSRCATKRLKNPFSALLPMRKVGSQEKETADA